MKRLWIGAIALIGVGVAVVLSGVGGGAKTYFPLEERNPVTHLRWNDSADEFRFVIVSDRTGGHRAEVFSQAVEKINLLQPEFVLCVGDLIEGGKKAEEKLTAEWKEFDGFVNKLTMPFFYVPGNHDALAKDAAKVWENRYGRRYYHFIYRNVLFLMLSADDPPGTANSMTPEQVAYAQKVLKDNAGVRWTLVYIHRPLWTFNNGDKNGWGDVEKALNGRSYTVFCGHVHHYVKFVRQGMNYYQLATTGGSSQMRGVEYGEFDHLMWVTMKKDGPVVANIMLDAVYPENLQKIKTAEKGVSTKKQLPTHPVRGVAYFEGAPMPGAVVTLSMKGAKANGVVEADGSFVLTTYKAFDGAPAGEYQIAVTWRESGKKGPSLLPARYTKAETSGLTAAIKEGSNDLSLELKK
jgi:serine/threonine-protein phosphatase CPPED1